MTQATKQPIDIMSFYIPHVDADINLTTIASVLQNQFEIGKVDRIEAVPKVNQTDGHKYNTCFVYLRKWGSSYNAQFLRNQIVEGKETKLYYMQNYYWKIFANTSVVAKLPQPLNYSLKLTIPDYYTDLITLETIKTLFDTLELGCVSNIDRSGNNIQVDFQYWYHTINAHQFQLDLHKPETLVLEPVVSEEYPDMQWPVCKVESPIHHNENPYIYYHQCQ